MPKFSIITPQYNSFDLMADYFKSLEKQTFKDFEVIIVDDCSTDGSYDKLQEFVASSKLDIKLFRSDINSGPGNARNIGLDHVSGEWITFVDNDDWVVDTFLEEINEVINREKINAVIYDYYGYLNGKLSIHHSMYIPTAGRKTVSDCVISARNHTVGKFYKFTNCNRLRFPNIRRCEDVAYVSQAIALCGGAYYLNKPLYYYRQRPTSLSNKSSLDETEMLQAFAILNKTIGEKYRKELCDKSVTDLLYGVLLMMCKAHKSRTEIMKYIYAYEHKYPEWTKSILIPYLGFPKRAFLFFARLHSVLGLKLIAKLHSYLISKGS